MIRNASDHSILYERFNLYRVIFFLIFNVLIMLIYFVCGRVVYMCYSLKVEVRDNPIELVPSTM